MDLLTFDSVYRSIKPIAEFLSVPTVVYGATLLGQAVGLGVRENTTLANELRRPRNHWRAAGLGAVVAGATAFTGMPFPHGSGVETAAEYVGAATGGAAVGAGLLATKRALHTASGVANEVRRAAREGAVKGAIAAPIAYYLVQEGSKRF